ncbi:hypothetical protein [Cellulomonas cellasea]|uniref:Uncharacterized protein n=2 Tax=Cellulomonas cellasea TaxID=43670 RepID=A0A0A0B8U2_9CELL|nr:hypothetical protein [Cellulomonas cellasea]KGM02613.1 hypothetical protein Q760_12460 [Cellulomonas cellasea DSM 20118]GEA87772.1 hypothetical protein CCE01nite_17210 [Cellulomonas cellasea]
MTRDLALPTDLRPTGPAPGALPRELWAAPVDAHARGTERLDGTGPTGRTGPADRLVAMLHAVLTGIVAGLLLGALCGGTVLSSSTLGGGSTDTSGSAVVIAIYGAVVGAFVGIWVGTLFGTANGLAVAALPDHRATRVGAALTHAAVSGVGGLFVAVVAPYPEWVTRNPFGFAGLCALVYGALALTAPVRRARTARP